MARAYFIYVHGVDTTTPSPQEMSNRKILESVASKESLRIALPRSEMHCPGQPQSICWGWKFDQAELAAALPAIIRSRETCFDRNKPFGVIGFSNGGYLLTRWFSHGMAPQATPTPGVLIASGSEKSIGADLRAKLSRAARLTLIIGTQDSFNFDPKEELFKRLRMQGADVRRIVFDGPHRLDEKALIEAVQESKESL